MTATALTASPNTALRDMREALDELFRASRLYHTSREYIELLKYISKFRAYAPFNGLLLQIQNPNLSYVASSQDWLLRFNRRPKHGARPLIILRPFGPVMFLYDLAETEGDPFPNELLRPFDTDGVIHTAVWRNTIHNCGLHGIEIHEDDQMGLLQGGKLVHLDAESRERYKRFQVRSSANYLILLNATFSSAAKYSTLAHELGHLFCGHVGCEEKDWWEHRHGDKNGIEIEAESVAFLVCLRQGLRLASESYLSSYKTPANAALPEFGFDAVLQATDYIEKMGRLAWKVPQKQKKERKYGLAR